MNAIKVKRPATKLLVAAFVLAGTQLFTSTQAKADTVATFDDSSITTPATFTNETTLSLTDNGIDVLGGGGKLFLVNGSVAESSFPTNNDSTNYVSGGFTGTYDLAVSLANNNNFNLASIDLALSALAGTSNTVTITGYTSNGGTQEAQTTATLDNSTFTDVILPSVFQQDNISFVTFTLTNNGTDNGGYLAADNVDIATGSDTPSPAPEPNPLLLVGTGLAGLAAVGFKRRSSLMLGLGN